MRKTISLTMFSIFVLLLFVNSGCGKPLDPMQTVTRFWDDVKGREYEEAASCMSDSLELDVVL